MTPQEAIDIIKTAVAEVEWEYPMEYAAAFDMAVDALERQESVKPINPLSPHGGGIYFCGKCKSLVGTHDKFCSQCGRRLDWGE